MLSCQKIVWGGDFHHEGHGGESGFSFAGGVVRMMVSKYMGNKKTVLMLFFVLLVGAGLRVVHFDSIQPVNSDEAMYLRQGRFIATLTQYVCGKDVPVINNSKSGIWRHVRKEDWYDKPCWLHSFLLAVGMLIFGVKAGAGAIVVSFFSLAAVLLVYKICGKIFGSQAAVVSAGLLAVSGYWMIYSRSFWAEADAVFFVVASFYLILNARLMVRRRWMMLLLAGAVGALSVLCHYRLLYIGLPLCLAVFVMLENPREKVAGAFWVGLGYAGMILIAAGVLRLAFVLMKVDIPFSGLIGAWMERYLPGDQGGEGASQTGFQPLNIIAFLYYLLRNNGWCTGLLCFLGLLFGFSNGQNRKQTLALVCFIMVPLLVLSFQVWVVERAGSLMIPFVCIPAGYGAVMCWRESKKIFNSLARFMVVCVAGVIIAGSFVENIVMDLRLVRNRMGHGDVAARLKQEKAQHIFVDPETACIYGWHEPDLRTESIHRLHDRLNNNALSGAYVVFDAQKFHMYPESTARVEKLEMRVNERGDLQWRFDNLTTMWVEFLLEGTQAHNLPDMLKSIRNATPSDITAIRVYRLK